MAKVENYGFNTCHGIPLIQVHQGEVYGLVINPCRPEDKQTIISAIKPVLLAEWEGRHGHAGDRKTNKLSWINYKIYLIAVHESTGVLVQVEAFVEEGIDVKDIEESWSTISGTVPLRVIQRDGTEDVLNTECPLPARIERIPK